MTIRISTQNEECGMFEFAKEDFKRIITELTNLTFVDMEAKYNVDLKIDESMGMDESFKIIGKSNEIRLNITIISGSYSGLLSGMYYMLEKAGVTFKMNGFFAANGVCFDYFADIELEQRPCVKYRGVRQHINFPMDISAYPIKDAVKYVYNLVRMGYNAITFHSYTGQWHGYETKDLKVFAGNYFYGQRHIVPTDFEIARYIGNRKYFCIPEIEDNLHNEVERESFSHYWLRRLIREAKRAGVNVCVSIELPPDVDTEVHIQICRNVLTAYPEIDAIEWITPEGGGGGPELEDSQMKLYLEELFGKDIFDNEKIYLPKTLPEALSGSAQALYRATKLMEHKDEVLNGFEGKKIYVGLYVMCKETLRILKDIMEKIFPVDVIFTFLPAHGALAVYENLSFMKFSAQTLARTMIYSWIEFDGNMYLLQNGCDGAEKTAKLFSKVCGDIQPYGICMNHWRTAENEITAGYDSKAFVEYIKPYHFYKDYADKHMIKPKTVFAKAAKELAIADSFNRDSLFNIGFCYLGCWLGNAAGIGWLRGYTKDALKKGKQNFENIIVLLNTNLQQTTNPHGIEELRLLINRAECSILHIECIECLMPITEFADDNAPESLSQSQKDLVKICCDKALEKSKQYLSKHILQLIDRGCEGTAVSYWATLPIYIDHILQYFAYGEKTCTHLPDSFDAPPPPNTVYS